MSTPGHEPQPSRDEHQRLRELLGSYSLGHLVEPELSRVRAHLDGCDECRVELAEIAPLAGLLDTVDLAHVEHQPAPPITLGETIRTQVAAERSARAVDELATRRAAARSRMSARLGLIAAALVLVGGSLAAGLVVGRGTAPEPQAAPAPAPAPAPIESVTLSPTTATALHVDTAGLVAHTWGVELRMTATGFTLGEVYEAAFRDTTTGELVRAGAFIGTGEKSMTCNLQSALLRAQASEVVIMDDTGAVVLEADL